MKNLIICTLCKKEKQHHAHGVCHACYKIQRADLCITCKNCKKKRPHMAHGLCAICYEPPIIKCLDCGKAAPHEAKGMCQACYSKKRKRRINVCTLCRKEKPHHAKGLCRSCYNRLNKYNVSCTYILDLLVKQNNRCAICKEEFSSVPCIDHDHSTNIVRELLCNRCNSTLGSSRESITILNNIIEYIKKHKVDIRAIVAR